MAIKHHTVARDTALAVVLVGIYQLSDAVEATPGDLTRIDALMRLQKSLQANKPRIMRMIGKDLAVAQALVAEAAEEKTDARHS